MWEWNLASGGLRFTLFETESPSLGAAGRPGTRVACGSEELPVEGTLTDLSVWLI